MVKMPRPTRAEVNDVANVVLDGADCLVLTRETAKSHYPVEAIAAVDRICIEAEAALWHHHLFVELIEKLQNLDAANSIGIAAVEAATKSNSTAIIVITTSGKSAFLIAKYKPRVPIVAVTRYSETARQANIYRGIIPLVYHGKRCNHFLIIISETVGSTQIFPLLLCLGSLIVIPFTAKDLSLSEF